MPSSLKVVPKESTGSMLIFNIYSCLFFANCPNYVSRQHTRRGGGINWHLLINTMKGGLCDREGVIKLSPWREGNAISNGISGRVIIMIRFSADKTKPQMNVIDTMRLVPIMNCSSSFTKGRCCLLISPILRINYFFVNQLLCNIRSNRWWVV